MENDKVDILAFAAHPDDIELACSGTIMKHLAAGKRVAIVDLTGGELGSRGTIDTRAIESADADKIMGLSSRTNLGMADGFFENNEENKRKIIEQIRRFQPEIILANAISDRHPDHARASKLVSEASFYSGLQKVETTFQGKIQLHHRPKAVYHYIQDHYARPDFVIDITDFSELKMKTILAYKTQFYNPNSTEPQTPISSKEFIDFLYGRMADFGRSIGAKYGEGFTVERIPGVELLTSLI
jgi:bacillithiol biosynthesis deacetylase BshB1